MPDTQNTNTEPSTLDKLDGESLDITAQRLAAIKAVLPEAFDLDGNLVRDKLLEALKPASYKASDDIPSFGLAWPGKQSAFAAAGVPTTATLRPYPDESVDFDTTKNLLIEGDNLEVLKTLQRSYHGKVKMIYIDPPYNTGKDFVYPDNYGEGLDTYLERTQQKDEDGFWKSTNSETSGRKHANWLSMMAPRLTLARNLLRDDGVIFISIDDNEVAHLRELCDEVFGAENFLCIICVKNNPRGRQSDAFLATTHEYVLVYSKKIANCVLYGEPLTKEQKADFSNKDEDGNAYRLLGLRQRGAASLRADRPDMYFPIYINPETHEVSLSKGDGFTETVVPKKSTGEDGRWMWGADRCRKNLHLLVPKLITTRNEYDIFVMDHLEREGKERTRKFKTVWDAKKLNTQNGTQEVKALLGTSAMSFPKPTSLLQDLLYLSAASDSEDVILDFFSGSGTTGHAVMAQNAADGGSRRYICVQLPEPLDESVTLDDGVVCETIFDLTRERLKRAGNKIKEEAGLNAEKLDTGLRVFKLDSSNFTAWNSDPTTSEADLLERLEQLNDQTVTGRSETDILWEMLLKMGLPLDLQLEHFELEGASFIGVAERTKVISTQDSIPVLALEALLDQDIPPSELVILDSAFADDSARANIATLYKERKDDDGKPVCNLKVV